MEVVINFLEYDELEAAIAESEVEEAAVAAVALTKLGLEAEEARSNKNMALLVIMI